jgi:HTH-type transcriptional regulator / antitoxin HigA
MTRAATTTAGSDYGELLQNIQPRKIETEEQNERYTAILEQLDRKPRRTRAEGMLAELLTLLIEAFEQEHYAFPPELQASPAGIVRYLMEANDLKQVDMAGVFGSAGITSEVLNGKRGLSKTHIRKLSERFHVSPAVFLEAQLDSAASKMSAAFREAAAASKKAAVTDKAAGSDAIAAAIRHRSRRQKGGRALGIEARKPRR